MKRTEWPIAENVCDTPTDLGFPGQWFQAESGLYQNWMRDYDPTTGSYIQPDPLGLIDGPAVYRYAAASPMRYVDPLGLLTISSGFEFEGFLGFGGGSYAISRRFTFFCECGTTTGIAETTRPGVGLSVGVSIFLNLTWGCEEDFYGDAWTLELDPKLGGEVGISLGIGSVGRTTTAEVQD